MIIGMVGKPSAGKSTFFKAATLAEVEIANFPFTTIKPNHGTGYVKVNDPALDFGKHSNPRNGFCLGNYRFVAVDLMDVAGLVPGAHEGKGLGNQFLNDLSKADAFVHVVDISGSLNERGEDVDKGSYDPKKDIEFLEYELDMWYHGLITKGWDKFARQINQEKGDIVKALAKQLSGLGVNEDHLKVIIKNLPEDSLKWQSKELLYLAKELRRKTKPMIVACNKIDIKGAKEKFESLKETFKDYLMVPCSAESELALREAAKHGLIDYIPGENNFKIKDETKLTEKQKNALKFIDENILKKYGSTGVQNIIDKAVFDLLKYKAIFPGGVSKLEDSEGRVLPDCFLMKKDATALDFAFKLHTDFGKNFIKAVNVKTKMPIGKDHILNNLDIVEIMSKK